MQTYLYFKGIEIMTKKELVEKYGYRAKQALKLYSDRLKVDEIDHILRTHISYRNGRFDYRFDTNCCGYLKRCRFYLNAVKEYKALDDPEDRIISSENQETDYCGHPMIYVEAFIPNIDLYEDGYWIAVGILEMDDSSQRYVVKVENEEEQIKVFRAMVDYLIDYSNTIVSRWFYDIKDDLLPQLPEPPCGCKHSDQP